jgi:cytochrome P450
MSFLDELDELADQVKDDAQELRNRAVKLLEQHAREHPDRLFKLLRTVKPVLLRHNLAIVTRYHDVAEILTHDEAFSVQPYREKMTRLAGDFILGTDDSPQYERDISILRLAAPRSDVPALAGFVEETAEALVDGAGGRINVADLSKRVPARLFGRWFGTPGPDEDTLIAWTLVIFEEIFVNVKNDPAIAAEANTASAALAAYLDWRRRAPACSALMRISSSENAVAEVPFEVAEGSMHATRIPAGTLTFAATQSAMLDDDVVDDPGEFRIGRPAHHHLHFGVGLHQCFGRFANAMQIPLIAKAVLRRLGLARAPGPEGQLVKDGPFPQSLVLTFEGS